MDEEHPKSAKLQCLLPNLRSRSPLDRGAFPRAIRIAKEDIVGEYPGEICATPESTRHFSSNSSAKSGKESKPLKKKLETKAVKSRLETRGCDGDFRKYADQELRGH